MSLSTYAETKTLDHITGNDVWTPPAGLWVALHLGDPGADCVDNQSAETARVQVSMGPASGAPAVSTSTAPIEFADLPAEEIITHASVWDAANAGNPVAYGKLSVARHMYAGDTLRINVLRLRAVKVDT